MLKEVISKRKKFTSNTYMREAIDYDIVIVKEDNLFVTIKKYKSVSEPFVLTNEKNEKVNYIDNDYYVAEITPLGENYNIRYYFDQDKKYIDYYIDITLENGVENKMPYYVDLYLDIIHYPITGKAEFWDEDELEEALANKITSKEDYDMAY